MITFCVVSGNSFVDAGFPVTSMVSLVAERRWSNGIYRPED